MATDGLKNLAQRNRVWSRLDRLRITDERLKEVANCKELQQLKLNSTGAKMRGDRTRQVQTAPGTHSESYRGVGREGGTGRLQTLQIISLSETYVSDAG